MAPFVGLVSFIIRLFIIILNSSSTTTYIAVSTQTECKIAKFKLNASRNLTLVRQTPPASILYDMIIYYHIELFLDLSNYYINTLEEFIWKYNTKLLKKPTNYFGIVLIYKSIFFLNKLNMSFYITIEIILIL